MFHLVFDLGHVLVNFEWMSVCYAFSERVRKPNHEILKAFSYLGTLGYEIGKIDTEQFLKDLNSELSSDITLDEFKKLWNVSFRENEEMAKLLTSLKQDYQLSLLSNTNECHYRFIQDNFNVERHFENVVLSYEVGASKPDSKIYQEVLAKNDLQANHCLFVDDLKPNVEAARQFGMQAILFTDPGSLKDELSNLGVKL